MPIKDAYIEEKLNLMIETLDSDHVLENMEHQAQMAKALWAHIEGLHQEIHELKQQQHESRTAITQHALDIEGNSVNVHSLIDELSQVQQRLAQGCCK